MMRKGSFPPSQPPAATDRLTGAVTWFSTSKGFGFIKPEDGSDDLFVHVSVVQRAGREGLREGATVVCEVAPGKKGRQATRLLDINDDTATAELGESSGPPDSGGGGSRVSRNSGGGGRRDSGGFGGGGNYGGGYASGLDRGFGRRDNSGYGGGSNQGFDRRESGSYGGYETTDQSSPEGDPGEGMVKWFNVTKGFGFITPDNGGKDVFLHASVVRRAGLVDVQPGQRVKFTSIERDKGPEARSLEFIADGN